MRANQWTVAVSGWSRRPGLLLALALAAGACGGDAKQNEAVGAAGTAGSVAPGAAGGPASGPAGSAGEPPPSAAGSGGGAGVSAPEAGTGGRSNAGRGGAGRGVNPAAGSGGAAGSSMTVPDAGTSSPDASTEDCAADSDVPQSLMLSGNLGTHDPALIRAGERYFLFHTGRGIPTKTSADLRAWQAGPPVFTSNPAWVAQQVPGATDLWAPDIAFFGGQYHLYYSVSTFGSNRSCIGHATRASLTEGSWDDHGSVICSNANGARDDWNAIDPNVVLDTDGSAWLSFGSFWSGIKLIALDEAGKRRGTELVSLARRTENGGAVEAPFIVHRCGFFYLFVSFDNCCRGADSTYKTMVGRSSSVRGPYVDRAGVELMRGGGTLLLQSDARWKGPGHNAVILTEAGAYNVYHAYGASDDRSMLRVAELSWDAEGWPRSGGP